MNCIVLENYCDLFEVMDWIPSVCYMILIIVWLLVGIYRFYTHIEIKGDIHLNS